MDKNRTAYDLAMCYVKETLRRMSNKDVLNFALTAPKIKALFDQVYELLADSLPEER